MQTRRTFHVLLFLLALLATPPLFPRRFAPNSSAGGRGLRRPSILPRVAWTVPTVLVTRRRPRKRTGRCAGGGADSALARFRMGRSSSSLPRIEFYEHKQCSHCIFVPRNIRTIHPMSSDLNSQAKTRSTTRLHNFGSCRQVFLQSRQPSAPLVTNGR